MFLPRLISDIDIPIKAISIKPVQLCRSLEVVWPAFLLRPSFRIVCRSVYLKLLQIRVDNFFAAVDALIIAT
jgi:hypothetical protein